MDAKLTVKCEDKIDYQNKSSGTKADVSADFLVSSLFILVKFSFHQQDKGKLSGRYHIIEVETLNALFKSEERRKQCRKLLQNQDDKQGIDKEIWSRARNLATSKS